MSEKKMLRVGLATLMALMLLAAPAFAAIRLFTTVGVATSSIIAEINPETDGQWLTYQTKNFIMPGNHNDIVLRDLQAATFETIGGGDTADQTNPDVSLGRVVYEDDTAGNTDIRVHDTILDTNYAIATTAANEVLPRISGNLVVWMNDSTKELWYRDLAQGQTAKVPGASGVENFDVDNGVIVWSEALVEEHIYTFDPAHWDQVPWLKYTPQAAEDITSVRMHGDMIVATDRIASGDRVMRLWAGSNESMYSPVGYWGPDVFHNEYACGFDSAGSNDIRWQSLGDDYGSIGSASLDDHDASIFGRRVAFERNPGGLNTDVYMATSSPEVDRTQGADRYLTAVEASKAYFSGSEWAILCTGANFPDALSAGPLAKALNCPLLLTRPDAIPAQVMSELDRLNVTDVILVGGADVVKQSVQTQIEGAGMNVAYRLAGDDRYATSVEVAMLMSECYVGPYTLDKAFFARGDNFPDALALGPVAAGAYSPIILVKPTSVPTVVADALDDLNITYGVIAGGPDVVSSGVMTELVSIMAANGADPFPVERWYGADRYATAVDIVENGVENRWIDLDTVGIATGINFPDALGGGAALGGYGSPILLVRDYVPSPVTTWVNANDKAIGRMDVFGGSDVVSDGVKNALFDMIK